MPTEVLEAAVPPCHEVGPGGAAEPRAEQEETQTALGRSEIPSGAGRQAPIRGTRRSRSGCSRPSCPSHYVGWRLVTSRQPSAVEGSLKSRLSWWRCSAASTADAKHYF